MKRKCDWDSLRLYRVDNEKKILGLKEERKLFKLKDRAHFDALKSMVLKYVPTREEIAEGEEVKFRIGVFMLLLFVCFIAWASTSIYYDHLSMLNEPTDRLCDVCGGSAYYYRGGSAYYYLTYEKPIHEYCQLHATIYAFLHPLTGIRSIPMFHGPAEFSLMIWAFLFILVILVSIPQWYRTKALGR